jgi:hypothetical protein
MEHPVYDIWVTDCRMIAPPEEPAAPEAGAAGDAGETGEAGETGAIEDLGEPLRAD